MLYQRSSNPWSWIGFFCKASLITQRFFVAFSNAQATVMDCTSLTANGPLFVTADCVDPLYSSVVIDFETDEVSPVAHRRISAHFNDSTTSINVYLPSADQWKGRFFHYVYPFQSPNATDENIGFAADSGAYWVQIADTVGYRAEAAASKWSREISADYYQTSSRIYGYLFGGSGGSFQTIGGFENSEGVWDGAVAFIQGVPASEPPDFTVRALAGFVLGGRTADIVGGKSGQIVNAVAPGGSGDPFTELTEFESSILNEATLMGVPTKSWEDFSRVGGTRSLRLLNASFTGIDPTYPDDFWTLPGYAGTEQSELGDLFHAALVNSTTTIAEVIVNSTGTAVSIVLDTLPKIANVDGIDFTIYDATGSNLYGVVWGSLDVATKTLTLYDASNATARASLAEGQLVTLDNKQFLSMFTYHRHQIPSIAGFSSFDQFLDADGKPLYPQRSIVASESLAKDASGGGTNTGHFSGKLIVVDNLMDSDAYPWHAHWYRSRVEAALGASYGDSYRLYYNDHANHDYDTGPAAGLSGQLVPFDGMIQYALRELCSWVQDGDLAAKSTNYSVTSQQVSIAATAAQRYGIQPIVALMANGNITAEAAVGEVITFNVQAEVPEGTSKIVSVEWDFLGSGNFILHSLDAPVASVSIQVTTSYNTTGTFFPDVRIQSQREGNASSPYARALNLGRARVNIVSNP